MRQEAFLSKNFLFGVLGVFGGVPLRPFRHLVSADIIFILFMAVMA